MQYEIQRDGDASGFEAAEDFEFLRVRFRAGKFVGGIFACSLEAELEMIETCIDEFVQPLSVERKTGSDEVDVEPGGASGLDESSQIGADERFAAGQIELHHTGLGGFVKDPGPDLGGQLFSAGGEFARVGAINAVQRAAVGEFGDDGERSGHESVSSSVLSAIGGKPTGGKGSRQCLSDFPNWHKASRLPFCKGGRYRILSPWF